MKILNFIKSKILSGFYAVIATIFNHKVTSAVVVAMIATVTAVALLLTSCRSPKDTANNSSALAVSDTTSENASSENESVTSSEEEDVSSEESDTTDSSDVSSTPVTSTPVQPPKPVTPNTDFTYNANMSPDDNVFLDALKYTGYKTDPRMWGSYGNYVLCAQKRGLGWLSNITYDDYGRSSGYEITENGLPDISFFEKKGLVCASYVAYVYFNYLPNVAGIDTSMLPKAENPVLANDWYKAAKQWVELGYSRYIDFTATDNGSIYQDLKLTPAEDIPIGSLIFLNNWYNRTDWSTHVSIYAGKVNGYHWVTHVGNENGPEFCAIERMNRNPHPQWMLAIVTPPSNIRFAASVEVTVEDQDGNPIKDVEIVVKNKAGGTVTNLGKTDESGKVSKDGLSYGEYEIIQTVPSGYTGNNSKSVNFTTENNSLNKVSFTNTKE